MCAHAYIYIYIYICLWEFIFFKLLTMVINFCHAHYCCLNETHKINRLHMKLF
jgi:hypothetical protein